MIRDPAYQRSFVRGGWLSIRSHSYEYEWIEYLVLHSLRRMVWSVDQNCFSCGFGFLTSLSFLG